MSEAGTQAGDQGSSAGTGDGGAPAAPAEPKISKEDLESHPRFAAIKAEKKKLEDRLTKIEADIADKAKAAEDKALEDAKDFEALKTRWATEKTDLQKQHAREMALRDAKDSLRDAGASNPTFLKIMAAELATIEDAAERDARLKEIVSDKDNAAFFTGTSTTQPPSPDDPPATRRGDDKRTALERFTDDKLEPGDRAQARADLLTDALTGKVTADQILKSK